MKFFITGLPRSRTAWLAEFFHNPLLGISCDHELLMYCGSMQEVDERMTDLTHGNSEPNLGYFMDDFLATFRVPVILINRDMDDVIVSCKKAFEYDPSEEVFIAQQGLQKLLDPRLYPQELVLMVDYDEVDVKLEEMWEFVTTGPFPTAKADRMMDLNIQVMPSKYKRVGGQFLKWAKRRHEDE